MVKIPVKFTRMGAAFHQASMEISSPRSDTSGTDHWTLSPSDHLSHLVNSFLEREIGLEEGTREDDFEEDDDGQLDQPNHPINPQFDFKSSLEKLFDRSQNNDDGASRNIHTEVEAALAELPCEPNFKRRMMARLRSRGFDAGLCKSKWEKSGRRPLGDYEYIDVNAGGNRYIVEVFLAGEFTIARATEWYSSLLEAFPAIFVGTAEELNQLVRLMSKAMRKSMKSMKLKLPPWRGIVYMLTKWFGPYKRTTNEAPSRKTAAFRKGAEVGRNISVGFVPVTDSTLPLYGRDHAYKAGVKIGNLAVLLDFKCIPNAEQIQT